MTDFAIRADGLAKTFGRTQALRDVSLRVPAGSVCALLGRNGAGKTTTVRILTTLIRLDAGRAEVAGFDVIQQPQRVRGKRHRFGGLSGCAGIGRHCGLPCRAVRTHEKLMGRHINRGCASGSDTEKPAPSAGRPCARPVHARYSETPRW